MDLPELAPIKPLLLLAQETEPTSFMYAFYVKAYAVQKINAIYKAMNPNNPNQKVLQNTLNQWINELSAVKQQNMQIFADKNENQQQFTNFVLKYFFDADTRERDGEVSKELMRHFQTVSKYFEVLGYFGQLPPEHEEKKKYSKLKAVEQMKKLKNPELAKASPEDDFEKQMKAIEQKVQQAPQVPEEPKAVQQQAYNPPTGSVFEKVPRFIPKQSPAPSQYPAPQPTVQQPPQAAYQQQPYQPPQQPYQPPQQPYQPPQQPQKPPQQPYQPPAQPSYPQQPSYPAPLQTPGQPLNQRQPQPGYGSNFQQPTIQPPQQQQYPQSAMIPESKLSALKVAEKRNQAKKFLENALSELDFKKYGKAQDNIKLALALVQELEANQ